MKVKSESESRNHHHTRPITVGAKSVYETISYAFAIVDMKGFLEDCETIVKQIKVSKSFYIPSDLDIKDSYSL